MRCNKMRDKIIRFMSGRYGFDRLGQALAISASILIMLSGLFGIKIFTLLSYVLVVWCLYRVCSKKLVLRANENRKFNELCRYVTAYMKRDRKTYRYFHCPKCRKTTKVPKGRGKIAITCPFCRNEFIKKT